MASLQHRPEQKSPWTVRWRENGSQPRKSFRLKSEAKAFLAEAEGIEARQRLGTYESPPEALGRTVEEQAERWMESRTHLSSSTQAHDRSAYEVWINPAIGHVKVQDVKPGHLESILADITKQGYSSALRAKVYQRLNMMLDHAVGPEKNKCRRVACGSVTREREVQPLTDAALEELLDAHEDPEWRLFTDTLASLGLRPMECLRLRVGDFDWREPSVTIKDTKRAHHGADKAVRTLPLPEHLIAPLKRRCDGQEPGDCVWSRSPTRSTLNNWRRRVFNPAAEQAGVGDRVPYDLRHTCASKLIAKGATPVDVSEWMGHSREMTLRVYGHMFPGRKSELAALLSR